MSPQAVAEKDVLAIGYAALLSVTHSSSGISPEAQTVRTVALTVMQSEEGSFALFGRKSAAISQIWALVNESREEEVDETDRISDGTAQLAADFVRALPAAVPLPEFAWEPDGSISLDWIQNRHRLLSLSIGEGQRLPYAWLDGTEQGHAVAFFDRGTIPARILEAIKRIMRPADAFVRPR